MRSQSSRNCSVSVIPGRSHVQNQRSAFHAVLVRCFSWSCSIRYCSWHVSPLTCRRRKIFCIDYRVPLCHPISTLRRGFKGWARLILCRMLSACRVSRRLSSTAQSRQSGDGPTTLPALTAAMAFGKKGVQRYCAAVLYVCIYCVYIYIYTYRHTYIHTCIHIYIHTYIKKLYMLNSTCIYNIKHTTCISLSAVSFERLR